MSERASQNGFSMIGVMVVVAVVGITIMVLLTTMSNQQKMRGQIMTRQSVANFEQAMMQYVWSETMAMLRDSPTACPKATWITAELARRFENMKDKDYANDVRLATETDKGDSCKLKYTTNDAIKDSGLDFCLTIEPSKNYRKLIPSRVQAHLRVGLVDILAGRHVKCETFFGETLPAMAGLRLQYEMTWTGKEKDGAMKRRIEDVYYGRAN